MLDPVVVRFAPSPTGPPHLGNLRTALFNWLLARATGGRFIVRIEDTDQTRYDPHAEDMMLSALRWLGLTWDEGPDIGGAHQPYRQSERLRLYAEAAQDLIESGHAYRCNCTAERLEIIQKRLHSQNTPKVYDGHCRDLEINRFEPHVIRMKIPLEGQLTFRDGIRGDITFDYSNLAGDIVLIKSDGFPTYHLGVVVDDHDMGTTHVIRGDEWIPSTPLHILLYNAFGWSIPEFVHLPLVVDRNGQKLKKRTPEFEAGYYQDKGYLPEAVVNALALMGWNPGTGQELLSPHEIIELFDISRLSSSPSIFDEERLRTFSREHIARLDLSDLASRILPLICDAYPEANSLDQSWLLSLVSVIREELSTLNDAIEAARFAFRPTPRTPEAYDALMGERGRLLLETTQARLRSLPKLTPENTSALFKEMRAEFKQSHNLNAQTVMFPLRAALSGSITGPHLSDIVTLLGKAETLQRLEHALAELP